MPHSGFGDSCQEPSCKNTPTDTYVDQNGNTHRLCERHYYQLVSKGAGGEDVDTSGFDVPNRPATGLFDRPSREIDRPGVDIDDLLDDSISFRELGLKEEISPEGEYR